ncbi:MAG: hypothetical protein A2W31_05435 [Planctomycetes bacterium RBG_16_64_10]|nr:MAG: hypothetical protein A2W31_05435 [Planctomycetes bacterium RBG_16_64_10]
MRHGSLSRWHLAVWNAGPAPALVYEPPAASPALAFLGRGRGNGLSQLRGVGRSGVEHEKGLGTD